MRIGPARVTQQGGLKMETKPASVIRVSDMVPWVMVLATKPDISSIPGAYMVADNQLLLQVVL